MNPDPRALIAGLRVRGVRVLRIGDSVIAAGPSRLLEDVDRIAIAWAKRALLEALR